MGRPCRELAEGGYVYHVLNRANARLKIFERRRRLPGIRKILLEAVEPKLKRGCWPTA